MMRMQSSHRDGFFRPRGKGLWVSLISSFLCLAVAGCGPSGGVDGPVDASRQNLQKIGVAYAQATTRLKRPPKNLSDLLPSLKEQGEPAEILRSPDDGEEYVILWGVDFRWPPPGQRDPSVVLAYEKRGKAGKRHVLRLPTRVVLMTDDELKKTEFPPGHQPAL